MKKFMSIFLSIVLIFAVLTPLYTTVNDKIERKSVARFCSAVTELTRKYDNHIAYAVYDEDGNKNMNTSANRLIVKTDDKINDADAIDCVYGLDYAVLQYANQGDMLKSYERLKSLGYTVDKDSVISICDAQSNEIHPIGLSDVSALVYASHYKYSDVDIALSRFNGCETEIVVGIMDTGIDYNHSEFAGRYIHNPVNFGNSGEADDPMDDQMHGTACASIVTQSTPENVKVKPYKILDEDGSATELNIIAACEYALAEKDKPDVMNMSFGGYAKEGSFALINDLIEKLVENGIAVSVAAGNESLPSDHMNPASCESVITVASCNNNNAFSYYSNYGNMIDVTAPGENIYVAKFNTGNRYTTEHSGTSFSAPFVSAACAYVLMQNPDATPAEVKDKIKSTAIDMGEEDRFYYGAGVLNFANLTDESELETPMPSVSGGLYHEAQTIEFDSYIGDLFYTTDGTAPNSKNGTVYTEPIIIDSDTQLTFALVSGNNYISPIATQHYTIQYYAPSSDFTIVAGTIMKYKGDKTNIVVPDKILGVKPTAVYKELFKNSNLTSIVLPDSVTTLGTGCFQGSSKLRHIVANGVTKLNGDSVFADCEDLRDEVMPKLKTVTVGAFKNCERLHEIDFGENLTEFKDELFSGAGLMHGNFPNVKDTATTATFKSCPLFTCDIPQFTTLYTKFFYGCNLLYNLNIGQVTEIFDSALYNCAFLNELDTSQLVTLNTNSLSGCLLDTLYAPKCTALPAKFGKYCQIRVIDLPNAEGAISSNMLYCSKTEELYLDKATSVSKSAFRNTISLNIVYLPEVEQYYEPYTNLDQLDSLLTGEYWEQKAPLEIVWVPKAELLGDINCFGTKLFYAPSAETLTLTVHSEDIMPNVIVSDKITEGNISVTAVGNRAVIISPNGTYAQKYAADENCNYTFVSTDNVSYSQLDERNYFTYITDDSDFSVPYSFLAPYWQNDIINKNRNDMFHGFLLDFVGDDVLNAKDYSILVKNADDK